MNINKINSELISLYSEWLPLAKMLNDSKGKDGYTYSAPFVTGVSNLYDSSKKTILLFGQEARNWHSFDCNLPLAELQKTAINYFNDNIKLVKNRSPFWNLVRELYKEYNVCWANLDKLHRYSGVKSKTSPLKHFDTEEKVLLSPLSDGKSIIQREIEIIKPDIALFVTGPTYHKSTKYALRIEDFTEMPEIKSHPIIKLPTDSATAFWTYHPNYLSYHNLSYHIALILSKIKEDL